MRIVIRIIILTVLAALPSIAAGNAQEPMFDGQHPDRRPERLAFVVGISDYQENFRRLPNARSDAETMSELFTALGVKRPRKLVSTTVRPQISRRTFFAELREFQRDAELSRQRTGVDPILMFYFAGHGFIHNSGSYIVPSDAFVLASEDVERHAIRLSDVITSLQATSPTLSVIIVDACRDLAFATLAPYAGKASDVKSGVSAATSIPKAEPGAKTRPMLLYYSTEQESTASDGAGKSNGPFAASLNAAVRAALAESVGREYRFLFDFVEAVNRETERLAQANSQKQRPEFINKATAKLPVYTTESHYWRERTAWDQIDGFIADVEKWHVHRLPPSSDPDFKNRYAEYQAAVQEERACRYSRFIDDYGYSFFWRRASKELEALSKPERCGTQKAARDLPRPQIDIVTEPDGETEIIKITATNQWEEAVVKLFNVATRPHFDIRAYDARWSAVFSSQRPPEKQALVVTADAMFEQSMGKGKGTRKILLKSGDLVEFIRFAGSDQKATLVRHAVHGYGTVPPESVAPTQGFFRTIFRIESGASGLSPQQETLLKTQLAKVTSGAEIATIGIRYSEATGADGTEAAVRIARMVLQDANGHLQRWPRIEASSELEKGLVEIVAGLEYCQETKPFCILPSDVVAERVEDILFGKEMVPSNWASLAAARSSTLNVLRGGVGLKW